MARRRELMDILPDPAGASLLQTATGGAIAMTARGPPPGPSSNDSSPSCPTSQQQRSREMDTRFDTFAKQIGEQATRRRVVRGLGALALGALGAAGLTRSASAQDCKQKCKDHCGDGQSNRECRHHCQNRCNRP